MGCVLGQLRASARSSPGHCDPLEGPGTRAQPVYRVGRVQRVLRAQHVLRAHAASLPRPSPSPGLGPPSRAAAASEARLRFGLRQGLDPAVLAPPSAGWDRFLRRAVWTLRRPGVRSPVTVRACPPGRRGPESLSPAPAIHCAGLSEPELRASPDPVGSDPCGERTLAPPSAFTPLAKRGALVTLVPRPGPLPETLGARGPASRAPRRSVASTSLRAKRNAICSSCSSTRPGPAPGKRGFPTLGPEIPEWPLREEKAVRPGPCA